MFFALFFFEAGGETETETSELLVCVPAVFIYIIKLKSFNFSTLKRKDIAYLERISLFIGEGKEKGSAKGKRVGYLRGESKEAGLNAVSFNRTTFDRISYFCRHTFSVSRRSKYQLGTKIGTYWKWCHRGNEIGIVVSKISWKPRLRQSEASKGRCQGLRSE